MASPFVALERGLTLLRTTLGAVVAALFYTSLPLYVFAAGHLPVSPVYVLVPVLLVVGLLMTDGTVMMRTLADPLIWWCVGSLVLNCLGLVVARPTAAALHEFTRRGLALAAIVGFFVLFFDARTRSLVGVVIAGGVILGAGLNLYEVTHPLTFSNVLGRSAGLYVNPNISGGALTAGAAVVLAERRGWWRYPFLAMATAGIVATLSRGAMVVWVACLGFLMVRRAIRLVPVGATILVGAVALFVGAQRMARSHGTDPGAILANATSGRVMRLASVAGQEEVLSANMRLEVARAAAALFRAHPVVGNGIAATTVWNLPQGSHNTVLRGAAENGWLGLLIIPALMLAVVMGRGDHRLVGLTYAVFLLGWSLLSHNLLEEWPFVVLTAFAATSARLKRAEAGEG